MSDFYVSERGDRPEPRNLGERTERILEMMANPSVLGAMPSPEQRYEVEINRLQRVDPPIRNLGDEMVMLGASLAFPAARALPYAVRMGSQGVASIRALSTEAEQAVNTIIQSFRNRLGRAPFVQELTQAVGIASDVGVNRATGLGNAFKGRTPGQVDRMFKQKGFDTRGEDPVGGIGGYVNPRSTRSYHIEPNVSVYREGTEYPHVDANRLRHSRGAFRLKKRKFPLGDELYGE